MSPRELALRIIKLGGMRYNIGMTKYPYKQSYAEMLQTVGVLVMIWRHF